jgi:hypothetical protein
LGGLLERGHGHFAVARAIPVETGLIEAVYEQAAGSVQVPRLGSD